MSLTLKNKRILVTRPRHQADQLSGLISDAGGEVILFPTIEIKPLLNSKELSDRFSDINNYDFIIFVSRNAVRVVYENYLNEADLSVDAKIFGIGKGTVSALSDMEVSNVLHAGYESDSESLLQLPELEDDYVQDKRVLIVRGVGGRELLADNLRARGATVEYAEVYQRCLPEYEIQECREVWQNVSPEAAIVSSNEGLENLFRLTVEADRKQLLDTPLVVMSERNADLARQMGYVADIKVAKEKSDHGLLSALLELVGEK